MFAVSAVAPAAPPKRSAKKKTAVKKTVKKIGAENGLVGIHLYDTGLTLLKKYGNPIDIQGVSVGGQQAGPGSGFGGPMSGPMGPGGMRGGAGPMGPMGPMGPGMGGGPSAADLQIGPESALYAPPAPGSLAPPPTSGSGGGSLGGGTGAPSGYPGVPGVPTGGMGPGMPSGSGMATGTSGRTVFTRWVYKRPESQYAFILDKFNRVVQIEAIGLADGKVRTARGISFGAQFKQIITAYGAPDAYEISGNSLVIRYLVKHKVAFRLNRLGENKPHVVTGVVVAAGKA